MSVFQWVLIVLLLLQICFCFVMRETLCLETSDIAPVFKKGNLSIAANYRPISLTSVCSKVLEHIIHSQIMKHLDTHQILTDQQRGFMKKRSCESQLILTVQDRASAMEANEQIDAIHSFYVIRLKYEKTLSYACKIFLLHDMLRHWVLYNSSNTCVRFLT